MKNQDAYNLWSDQYDDDENKTRDMEAQAIKEMIQNIPFKNCLEIGCGTGKNTVWLVTKATQLTAVDFSEKMIEKARRKITSDNVSFITADITQKWDFTSYNYDMISFSLVLEHIENLRHIFSEVTKHLNDTGYVYVGELHPFKQYSGSKARFETSEGLHITECYTHNVSDFLKAASDNGLKLVELNEYFDDDDRRNIPRLITMLLRKEIS